MPVDDGRYLRGWGSGAEGYHLAIDIGAPSGTEIHAAERGLVVYAGHGIRGYGNVVVLVHPNGWVTAYAHARQNLVVPGQRVERGEVISRVGMTGYARGPHLHFMLVHEGRHCDPLPALSPRSPARRCQRGGHHGAGLGHGAPSLGHPLPLPVGGAAPAPPLALMLGPAYQCGARFSRLSSAGAPQCGHLNSSIAKGPRQ